MQTVSVVITFYNSDATFEEALRSVQSQTRQPDEIIVVDDCSIPGKSETLAKLPTGIRLIRLPSNSGPGVARQAGSDEAASDWVAYLDADDIWHPNKLERQLMMAEHDSDLSAMHCGTVVLRNGVQSEQYIDKPPLLTPDVVFRGGHTLPSSFMIRRDVLQSLGGWTKDRYVLEDWDLAIRLVIAGYNVGFLPEPLTIFRRDDHGNLTSDPWHDLVIHLACIDRHKKAIASHLGSSHLRSLRLKYLQRFAWALPKWPGRFIRLGAWVYGRWS